MVMTKKIKQTYIPTVIVIKDSYGHKVKNKYCKYDENDFAHKEDDGEAERMAKRAKKMAEIWERERLKKAIENDDFSYWEEKYENVSVYTLTKMLLKRVYYRMRHKK